MRTYLESRITGIWRFLRRVLVSFGRDECNKQAAALSYFGLFSIFPLMLFMIYIASFFFPSEASRSALVEYMERFFPYGGDNLGRIVEQTWKARGSIGIVSGLTLLWGGSSVFSVLETSLSRVWRTKPRTFWRRRALAVISVLALVVFFLASFVFGPIADLVVEGQILFDKQTIDYFAELLMVTLVLMVLYAIFPNDRVHWGAAFMGAFISAVLIVLARFGFGVYTKVVIDNYGLLYGSLAWFVTLALWVYILALMALFGAEFAAEFQKRQEAIARFAEKQAKSEKEPEQSQRPDRNGPDRSSP
jgi:membrane protein